MSNAGFLLIGTVLSAVIAGGCAVYVARLARRAGERGHEIEEKANAVQGFDELTNQLRADIRELRQQRRDDAERITKLETRAMEKAYLYRMALRYIHDLLVWIKAHTSTQPPGVPTDLVPDIRRHQ